MADTNPGDSNKSRLQAAVAKRARWGTPGDFSRCHAFLVGEGVGDEKANRICSSWHHAATGKWPGDAANK